MTKINKRCIYDNIYRYFVLLSFLILNPYLYACDFEIDGIAYKKLSGSANEVEVTANKGKYGSNIYSGNVCIPSEAACSGITYKVTGIGDGAFSELSEIPTTMPTYDVTVIGTFTMNETEIKTYELNINARGNGFVSYNGTSIRDQSSLLWVYEGSDVVISFFPDNGSRIVSVKVNNIDVTSNIANNTYTISNFNDDTIVEVEFEQPDTIVVDGIYYWVGEDNTVSVKFGEVKYSGDVVIPESVEYGGKTYSVTFISNGAFYKCGSLTSVNIPKSVTAIGEMVFALCENLTSVTIGNGIMSIGERAFDYCPNLSSVHITDLEAWCRIQFYDKYSSNPLINAHHLFLNGEEIKALEIPNTVISINDYAFRGCSGLTSVTIPNSVISIGAYAFRDCIGLTSVISEIGKPFKIDNYVFYGIPSDAKLIVPKGTKAAYQATEGWNQFTNIVEAGESEPDQSGQISSNRRMESVY